MTPQAIERYWGAVAKTEGCWEWTGYITRDGIDAGSNIVAVRIAAFQKSKSDVLDLVASWIGVEADQLGRAA